MRGKLAFVLGAAVGYVLGTRAGRERYEQIKRGAQRVWRTEPVQRGVHIVKDAVDDRADELKAFAVRLGNDVFSNLAKSRDAGKSGGGRRTEAAAEDEASTSKSTASKSSSSNSSQPKSSASKSSASRSSSSKSSASKSSASKSSGSGSSKSASSGSRSSSGKSKAGS